MALAGDAGQHALIAWHMGWEPARETSGDQWLALYLAQLMTDEYPAVRFMAHRSLTQIGGYADMGYHSEMSDAERQRVANAIASRWGTAVKAGGPAGIVHFSNREMGPGSSRKALGASKSNSDFLGRIILFVREVAMNENSANDESDLARESANRGATPGSSSRNLLGIPPMAAI